MSFDKFLVAVESRDLSQVSSFPKAALEWNRFTSIPKKLQFGKIDALVNFIIQKFARFISKHFSQFFWWEVKLGWKKSLVYYSNLLHTWNMVTISLIVGCRKRWYGGPRKYRVTQQLLLFLLIHPQFSAVKKWVRWGWKSMSPSFFLLLSSSVYLLCTLF